MKHPSRLVDSPLNRKRFKRINLDPIKICEIVYSVTKINPLENLNTRKRPYVEIRQLTMYLIRDLCVLELAKVGKYFNRDHATVLHAIKTMEGIIHFQKLPIFVEYYYDCIRKIEIESKKSETIKIVKHSLEDQDLDELKTINAELVFNVNYLLELINEIPQGIKERYIDDEEFIHTIRQKNTELAVV
jgi:hypothetical protein